MSIHQLLYLRPYRLATVSQLYSASEYVVTCMECGCRLVLDRWPDLLDSVIHNSWLHFTVHYYTHTHTHTHTHTLMSTVTSSLLLFRSSLQRWTFPLLPNRPRPQLRASQSVGSQLSPSSPLTNCNPVTSRLAVHRQSVLVLAPGPLRLTTRDFVCNWTLAVIVLMKQPLWREDGFISNEVYVTGPVYNISARIT
jgi:hypothetical protein